MSVALPLQKGAPRVVLSARGLRRDFGGFTAVKDVDLDVHESERSMFLAGMDGLPPLNDLVTIATVSEARNDRNRRFFQPMLVDRLGQRGAYVARNFRLVWALEGDAVRFVLCVSKEDPEYSPHGA